MVRHKPCGLQIKSHRIPIYKAFHMSRVLISRVWLFLTFHQTLMIKPSLFVLSLNPGNLKVMDSVIVIGHQMPVI